MSVPQALAISTVRLTKQYPAAERLMGLLPPVNLGPPAVDAVSLSVKRGELFGLLGPNGAGKTTLVKMLCTLIEPTSGRAWVGGFDLRQERAIKGCVGLVASDERSFYWRLTGRQNLEFFATLQHLSPESLPGRVEEVLAQVNLREVADREFRVYSSGMRQRLSIARALLTRPSILFLDEPTKGLDPLSIRRLHHLIREELTTHQGLTVFLTTHWLDEAEKLCDRVAVMHQGSLRGCGTLPELRRLIGFREQYRIRVSGLTAEMRARLGNLAEAWTEGEATAEGMLEVPREGDALHRALDAIQAGGGQIISLALEQPSLEAIFSRLTQEEEFSPEEGAPSLETPAPRDVSPPNPSPVAAPSPPGVFLRVARAFLVRDWHQEFSYRFSLFLQFAGIFFSVAVFYFVAQLLGEAAAPFLEPYGGDYFSFVLIGIAFVRYFGVGLASFSQSLRQAQTTGTLEAMLTTPTRLSTIILSSSLWSYGMTTLQVLVYLGVGVAFLGVQMGGGNYLAALLVLVLTVFTFSSLGILAASFIMVLKRGDPVTWLFNAVSSLLGGVYYPIAVLPGWLQPFSKLVPITYALRALRLALLQGASWRTLVPDILALAVFSAVLLPLSLVAFRYAVRRARLDGSLTHY